MKLFLLFPLAREDYALLPSYSSRQTPWELPESPGPGAMCMLAREGHRPGKEAQGFHTRNTVMVPQLVPLSLCTHSAISREFASRHLGVNNYYSPEFILLITDTVPEDFPDKPELDHGLDGIKSLPGVGSIPFLIFIPYKEEMFSECKICI